MDRSQRTHRLDAFAADERGMHGQRIHVRRLRQTVLLPQCPIRPVGERLERLARRTGVDDDDPLRSPQAKMQAHVSRWEIGVGEKRAADLLMVLTSYETFRELRLSGLSETQSTKALQESARTLLLG